MSDEQQEKEEIIEDSTEMTDEIPIGIVRLRDEWHKLGLTAADPKKESKIGLQPVVFPEPVGDYKIPVEEARTKLGLSEEAMNRLLAGGELDSIQVRFADGVRRMVSEAAISRFIDDSGMDTEYADKLAASNEEITTTLDELKCEMNEIREFHSRQLQQFKDVILLELRNLKEQDRDLASFIFDLTSGLEELNPKLKKRKRTPPPSSGEDETSK